MRDRTRPYQRETVARDEMKVEHEAWRHATLRFEARFKQKAARNGWIIKTYRGANDDEQTGG